MQYCLCKGQAGPRPPSRAPGARIPPAERAAVRRVPAREQVRRPGGHRATPGGACWARWPWGSPQARRPRPHPPRGWHGARWHRSGRHAWRCAPGRRPPPRPAPPAGPAAPAGPCSSLHATHPLLPCRAAPVPPCCPAWPPAMLPSVGGHGLAAGLLRLPGRPGCMAALWRTCLPLHHGSAPAMGGAGLPGNVCSPSRLCTLRGPLPSEPGEALAASSGAEARCTAGASLGECCRLAMLSGRPRLEARSREPLQAAADQGPVVRATTDGDACPESMALSSTWWPSLHGRQPQGRCAGCAYSCRPICVGQHLCCSTAAGSQASRPDSARRPAGGPHLCRGLDRDGSEREVAGSGRVGPGAAPASARPARAAASSSARKAVSRRLQYAA